MSDPLIDPSELATYLKDPNIDEARAELMISLAQAECESILSPLPTTARNVVMRVAARGYLTVLSTRQVQTANAGDPYAGVENGCVDLRREDVISLRRLSGGGGGAFSVDLLPADYVAPVSHGVWGDWDRIA